MFDLWAFLLQTLNVSGVAVLILIVKALFKDKLPPKWQFASWSILGMMILLPAGMFGTYTLVRWQIIVELIKSYVDEYEFTRVLFPFPIVKSVPQTVSDWLFVLYIAGIAVSMIGYLIAYLRLKRSLRLGEPPSDETSARIHALAVEHGIKNCRVICVKELPSAFVFGIFRPTLVIPAQYDIDDKVIMHELFHLKNKDNLWSVIICILKSFHWCNPLIVYCANRALNDMESRCDQFVLESVVGEERREYGNILLSMTNERFSKTPGSTSIHNGEKNIRARIENIARFKKYPKGMKLVSVCVLILLAVTMVTGTQVGAIRESATSRQWMLATARTTPCTTYAGAFDTYGKSVLNRNGYYRAMCAPERMQKELKEQLLESNCDWNPGINEWANQTKGYYIYNLSEVDKNIYEGLFVVELNYPVNGKPAEINTQYLAVQNLRVQKENGRWVTIPLEDFRYIESINSNIGWNYPALPEICYNRKVGDFRIEITFQTVHTIDNTDSRKNGTGVISSAYYNSTPNPHAKFTSAANSQLVQCIYLGDEAKKDQITHIGLAYSPVYKSDEQPANPTIPPDQNGSSSSNLGAGWSSHPLHSEWNSTIDLGGAGTLENSFTGPLEIPQYYIVDLYINQEKVAEAELYPTERRLRK